MKIANVYQLIRQKRCSVQHTPHLVIYHSALQPSVPKQQSLVCWWKCCLLLFCLHSCILMSDFRCLACRHSQTHTQTHRQDYDFIWSISRACHQLFTFYLIYTCSGETLRWNYETATVVSFCACFVFVDAVTVGCQKEHNIVSSAQRLFVNRSAYPLSELIIPHN